jgi:DNA-binding LytR/AlgR family response regulator
MSPPPRVLVVDDEPLVRDGLLRKLAAWSGGPLDGKGAADPHEALALIRSWRPQIVLLDIAMPGMTGFELLGQLGEADRRFALVFCTAYAEHAIRAFEAAALDYLLKPVDPERLDEALRRALASVRSWERWERALPAEPLERLAARTRKGVAVVAAADVARLTSEAHETVAYAVDGTELVLDLSLAELETRLDPRRFFRCHRAHIVNLAHVTGVLDAETGPVVELARGAGRVPLARRRRTALLDALTGGPESTPPKSRT